MFISVISVCVCGVEGCAPKEVPVPGDLLLGGHLLLGACSRGRRGGIPACLAGFQAHTQGEVKGDVAGVSRPTSKLEVEGDLVQAHTQGGS